MLTTIKAKAIELHKQNRNSIYRLEIFKRISREKLAEMERYMVERKFDKRESIFCEDDRADYIWLVKEGFVKEVHHSEEGRDSTLSIVGPGGLFGLSAFDGGPTYGYDGVAGVPVTAWSFPVSVFRGLMDKCPGLASEILGGVSKLLRRSKATQTFSRERVEKRILHALVELTEEMGNVIPLTRKDVAELVGTSVETCIRTFTRLEKEKLVTSVPGKIMVNNMDLLKLRLARFTPSRVKTLSQAAIFRKVPVS